MVWMPRARRVRGAVSRLEPEPRFFSATKMSPGLHRPAKVSSTGLMAYLAASWMGSSI